ncbi:MAG: protein kinase [Legionellaceae bacterium]|nr:protein kinase [Legionellaceae bacterium]
MNEQQQTDFIDAITHNKLPTLQAIIDENNAYLDCTLNDARSNALHMAVYDNNLDVVRLLLNAYHAKYSTSFYLSSPYNHCNVFGYTPLTLALLCEHYEVANLILHQALNGENHDAVFEVITSAEQALELMVLDPNIAKLMLNNPRIKQLISTTNHDNTTNPIGFYKLSGQHPSFYAEINPETGETDLFREQCILGQGTHAHVRLFTNQHGASFAVKTPYRQRLGHSKESIENTITDYHQEHIIMRRAYNNPCAGKLFFFEQKTQLRSLMPYIHGEQIQTYLPRVQSVQKLARIILAMTEALIRLHQDNIIHGDIKLDNIMISTHPNLKITFIDFGFSYLLTDKAASCFSKEEQTAYLAPERFDYPNDIAPHPNQDVYSFAYNLNYYILNTHQKGAELKDLYPSIDNFAKDGRNTNPELRPSLTSLYEALSQDIQWHCDDGITVLTTRI